MRTIEVGEVIDALFKALNAKDFDEAVKLYASDVVQYEAAINKTSVGVGAVIARINTLSSASSDLQFRLRKLCVSSHSAVLELTCSGTNTAPFLDYQPTHNPFEFTTCSALEVENGKIVKHTTYLDIVTVMRALGLVDFPEFYRAS